MDIRSSPVRPAALSSDDTPSSLYGSTIVPNEMFVNYDNGTITFIKDDGSTQVVNATPGTLTVNIGGTATTVNMSEDGTITLSKVASTGSYDDLSDTPAIPAAGTTTPSSSTTSGSVGSATTYARSDHAHPAQTTVTGNAGTATTLATSRTIQTNLSSTSSASFNGSANVTPGITGTLPVAYGGTGATTATGAKTALGITDTDTKVTQTSSTTTSYRPILLGYNSSADGTGLTTEATNTTYISGNLYLQPSSGNLVSNGTVTATSFVGNASSATVLATSRTIQTNLSSTSGTSFNGSANVTPGVTGTLGVSNGGTGATTLTSGGILKGNGTSAVTALTGTGALYASTSGSPLFGTLPIAQGGTGNTTGLAASATILATSRTIQTNLSSTSSASFNGSANITPGITGTLGIANGGTGNTTGLAASATVLATSRTIQTNLSSTSTASFNGSANVTPGVTGTLALGNGGTGATTAAAARTNLDVYSEDEVDTLLADKSETTSLTNLSVATSAWSLSSILGRYTCSIAVSGLLTTHNTVFVSPYYINGSTTANATSDSTNETSFYTYVDRGYVGTNGYLTLVAPEDVTATPTAAFTINVSFTG